MSVYRPKGAQTYVYDFQWRGDRFSGATGAKSKREALQVEQGKRDALRRNAETAAARESLPMTLDEACDRYWTESGRHAKRNEQVEWSIDYLLRHLGEATPIRDITDDDVAALVSRRRGDRVDNVMVRRTEKRRPGSAKVGRRVSAATVNRSVLEPLRRILLRARDAWGKEIGQVQWKRHRLKEPKERIRALSADEEARLFAELPDGYAPIARFALRTGCRAMECVNLRWSDIDWGNRTLTILGKGDKVRIIPLPLDVRDILFPLQKPDREHVFLRPDPLRKDGTRGADVRITYRAFYSAFRRACRAAGVANFRIHDLRHTAATRIVRRTGNLKLAMKMLGHEDISTTSKYAAVLDADLRAAMDALGEPPMPTCVAESHKKSHEN